MPVQNIIEETLPKDRRKIETMKNGRLDKGGKRAQSQILKVSKSYNRRARYDVV